MVHFFIEKTYDGLGAKLGFPKSAAGPYGTLATFLDSFHW